LDFPSVILHTCTQEHGKVDRRIEQVRAAINVPCVEIRKFFFAPVVPALRFISKSHEDGLHGPFGWLGSWRQRNEIHAANSVRAPAVLVVSPRIYAELRQNLHVDRKEWWLAIHRSRKTAEVLVTYSGIWEEVREPGQLSLVEWNLAIFLSRANHTST
jgi:hypothetical protein